MGTLSKRQAELSQTPKKLPNSNRHVTIGDLHGNALKLIYTLAEEGILQIRPSDYKTLRRIYNTPPDELNRKKLNKFINILERTEINPEKTITLIGDEVADRGQNDYFTLLVLKRLKKGNVKFNICLSNHSIEFIRDYESAKFTGESALSKHYVRSLQNMVQLIHSNIIDETELRNLIRDVYIPSLQAIGYSISRDLELSIYTHAPVGLETIASICDFFKKNEVADIEYDDTNPFTLARTINEINATVQKLHVFGKSGEKIASLVDSHIGRSVATPVPLTMPFFRLVWNRLVGQELITTPIGAFKLNFVHGHVGDAPISEDLLEIASIIKTHTNIDNNFGKSEQLEKAENITITSDDLPGNSHVYLPLVHMALEQAKLYCATDKDKFILAKINSWEDKIKNATSNSDLANIYKDIEGFVDNMKQNETLKTITRAQLYLNSPENLVTYTALFGECKKVLEYIAEIPLDKRRHIELDDIKKEVSAPNFYDLLDKINPQNQNDNILGM